MVYITGSFIGLLNHPMDEKFRGFFSVLKWVDIFVSLQDIEYFPQLNQFSPYL